MSQNVYNQSEANVHKNEFNFEQIKENLKKAGNVLKR